MRTKGTPSRRQLAACAINKNLYQKQLKVLPKVHARTEEESGKSSPLPHLLGNHDWMSTRKGETWEARKTDTVTY
jgi:hypothetical protein